MSWVNLYDETAEALLQHNLSRSDIWFVCTDKEYIDWDEFKDRAQNFRYNNGFGVEEVRIDLKIVGKDWWLERWSYDGAEGWQFKQKPDFATKTHNGLLDISEGARFHEIFG